MSCIVEEGSIRYLRVPRDKIYMLEISESIRPSIIASDPCDHSVFLYDGLWVYYTSNMNVPITLDTPRFMQDNVKHMRYYNRILYILNDNGEIWTFTVEDGYSKMLSDVILMSCYGPVMFITKSLSCYNNNGLVCSIDPCDNGPYGFAVLDDTLILVSNTGVEFMKLGLIANNGFQVINKSFIAVNLEEGCINKAVLDSNSRIHLTTSSSYYIVMRCSDPRDSYRLKYQCDDIYLDHDEDVPCVLPIVNHVVINSLGKLVTVLLTEDVMTIR